jgi:hypothetical protein
MGKDVFKPSPSDDYQVLKKRAINSIVSQKVINQIFRRRDNNQMGRFVPEQRQQRNNQNHFQGYNSSNAPRRLNDTPVPMDLSHARGFRQGVSRTVTPEPRKHVTVRRSHDQTGSDPPCDPPRDQSRGQAPKPASNQSCDKEREHDLMHAYFCRRNLCYVHNRY